MQMNWRLLTAINAAIALVTICGVIYIVTRSPAPKRTHRESAKTSSESNSPGSQSENRPQNKVSIETVDDLTNARVDDLGSVPAVELTQLMSRATPAQLAMLAAKFNDAPTDARTFGGMGVFFQAWAELDPKAALSGAFQLGDITMRKLAATAVVNSVSPSAAAGLIAMLSNNPDRDLATECKTTFLDPLIASWSSLDPEAASKLMDELGDTKSSLNSSARNNIAYNWGTLDPQSALEWTRKQQDKDYLDSSYLYDQVIRGWCVKDLRAASDYVAQHLDDPAAQRAAASVAEAMFTRDPDQATNWVRGMPTGTPKSEAESTIAQTWIEKDPAAMEKWLATLPESEESSLVDRIMPKWLTDNSTEASRWISTTTGEVHDQAIIAEMAVNQSYPDSLSLAFSIGDFERRNSVIEDNIRSWADTNPQAAEEWVKGSSLPTDQQQKLLSVISDAKNSAATEATAERVIIDH